MNEDQLVFVIARLAAASRTRSRRLSRGRFTCRWSTFTWCRSTRSSMSFSSVRRPPSPRRRWIRKYRSENSMELLPAEENACYRCSRLRIGEVEPFRPRLILTPIRAPNANAYAERVIETVRAECLDWTLILGRRHLDRTLRTYAEHYN